MSTEISVIILLAALLIVTQVFWANICLKLSNRLMSRNYYEVVQAEKLGKTPTVLKPLESEMKIDPEDERQASELNSLFGIV